MTSAEFWDQQDFSYITTYSFNRGPKLLALRQASEEEFKKSRQALLTAPAGQLPQLRARLRLLERNNDLNLLPLTEGLHAFHITAAPVALIEQDAPEVSQLAEVLRLPVREQMHWMCSPVYRDALAFHDKQGSLVSILNICFECDKMLDNNAVEIQADTEVYRRLRKLLVRIGHATVSADATERENERLR